MPHFPEADPRHPNNQAHTLYLALQEAGLVGQAIEPAKWRAIVKAKTGVLTDKAARDYTQHMGDLLMVKRVEGDKVLIRPNGLRLVAG